MFLLTSIVIGIREVSANSSTCLTEAAFWGLSLPLHVWGLGSPYLNTERERERERQRERYRVLC